MKKSRLLFALVIGAFGTFSLTSCEQTVSSVDSISVTAPEEELVVGQTIDLKDYIKGMVKLHITLILEWTIKPNQLLLLKELN